MLRIALLGSTGSIGRQTLDVVREFPERLQVVALAAGRNRPALDEQAHEFGVSKTAVYHEDGMDALVAIAADPEVDLVVVSVAGVIGLLPTLAAIDAGKRIALASKEVLVAAGETVMPLARERGVLITPIDSEHSALFQCMLGSQPDQIDRLILTASGGPFRGRSAESLASVTVDEALDHPTWRMGGKITVDSATLMNKGLEMIEARWLFDIPVDQIDVVVHPQSIAHSFVKFKDGSVLGQFGWPNMRLPILYALLYPERMANSLRPWNPVDSPTLTFEPPDEVTFRTLELARRAARVGGTLPCVLNAANEEAANAFLRREVSFLAIADLVEQAMEAHQPSTPTLESLLEADAWARATTLESIRK